MAEAIVYYTVWEDVHVPLDEKYIHALPTPIQKEILLYKQQGDINRLTAGKYLLRQLLKDIHESEVLLEAYEIDAMGKPFIAGSHPFNISHSGRVVACALLPAAGHIGIDVEKMREIEVTKFTRQFSPPEMMQILSSEDPEKKFFDYWTMKEAVMKADGRGMRIPLHSIRLQQDHATIDDTSTRWNVYPLELHETVKAHVCSEISLNTVHLKQIPIEELFI